MVQDIQRIQNKEYLNDTIINVTLNITVAGESKYGVINTYYMQTSRIQKAEESLRHWHKKIDAGRNKKWIIPRGAEQHWTVGITNPQEKSIELYDSLQGTRGIDEWERLRQHLS